MTGGTFSSGDFKVIVAEGTIPTSVNAISPEIKKETSLPEALTIKTNETNITGGAKAYTFHLGETGFFTKGSDAVKVTIPFDLSLVPDPTKINSLTVYVKLFNQTTDTFVPLHGKIVGNNVVIELKGLPANMVLVAVFNPDMRGVVASEDAILTSKKEIQETSQTWEAKHWYTVYDKKDVYDSIQKFLKTTGPITDAQIEDVVKTQISENAAMAARFYKNEGFRSPNICIAKTPDESGGDTLGTTPRYLIEYTSKKSSATSYLDASASTYLDARDVVDSDGNHYGRIFIESNAINETKTANGFTVFGTIAHEMFHAIQNGYELYGNSVRGIKEGTATTYAETLDKRLYENLLSPPSVRQIPGTPKAGPPSWTERETFLLSNYLMIYPKGVEPYSNQDFFVYFSRKYGGNEYGWLGSFFEQIHSNLQLKVSKDQFTQPPYHAVMEAMDLYFAGVYGKSLKDVYLDFVRNRAMEHNEQSRFGRPNETVTGLAKNLFHNNCISERMIDPINVQTETISFTGNNNNNIYNLSTNAIRITPTSAITEGGTGATLTLTVTANGGILGDTLIGTVYRKNDPPLAQSLQSSHSFTDFGTKADDEIVILLSNVHLDQTPIDVTITITGQNGSLPDTGVEGQKKFTITDTTIPNLKTPVYFWTTSLWHNSLPNGPYLMRIGSSSDTGFMGIFTNYIIQIEINPILVTGPGIYSIGKSSQDSSAYIFVLNDNLMNSIGSVSGTINFTRYGVNEGDRWTGSFNAVVEDMNGTYNPDTGSYPKYNISASFDLPWGDIGYLE